MRIYEEFEMLKFGNVPTVKVELPVSKASFSDYLKLFLGLLGAVICGFMIGMFIKNEKDKKNEALIKSQNDEIAQKSEKMSKQAENLTEQSKTITEQAQLISEYKATYRLT